MVMRLSNRIPESREILCCVVGATCFGAYVLNHRSDLAEQFFQVEVLMPRKLRFVEYDP